ncbi:hypothetical protein [Hymenobacter bucti]|uniref:hypothetical protein n=1 Tax=Hymenobacter bucti TaxID=1844114 RepID=UPI00363B8693
MSQAQQAPRAATGDTVWVIMNHVKADKRAQFERFCSEQFWPMARKLSPADQRAFRQTRVLNATRPDADGTYTYLFIMDPRIPKMNYSINAFLEKMYGKEQAVTYSKQLADCLAREANEYVTVQSRF